MHIREYLYIDIHIHVYLGSADTIYTYMYIHGKYISLVGGYHIYIFRYMYTNIHTFISIFTNRGIAGRSVKAKHTKIWF